MPKLPAKLASKNTSVIPCQTSENSPAKRLAGLLGLLYPVPEEWLKPSKNGYANSRGVATSNGGTMECLPCTTYPPLVEQWQTALKWTDGLDHALVCMLACIASTNAVGDQLWIKVIGPAACGKSTLCEAISVCPDYVLAKSTIRGFHSGYRTDDSDSHEDNSLLATLNGKTLVTKDGDTLLQSPNLPQILSEGRDVYDGCSRTHYRNKASKDYNALRITWILCGTSSLRAIDSSELGERFLDVVIMESIDDDLEDEVLKLAVDSADRDLNLEISKEDETSHYEPNLCLAMQLTGGYLKWLRENAAGLLPKITIPDESKRKCARLGKFVAHMRARPSIRQEENAEREFGSRLAKQLTRMAKCIALVLNKTEVDAEVMRRTAKVAMDTSRGQTLAIAAYLKSNPGGLSSSAIALYTNRTEEKTKVLLRFLRQIGVVDLFDPEPVNHVKQKPRWRLTARMRKLYSEIM